ncbi:MAG: hypothetical protein ABR500_00625 [Dermatophilaceae bacterium]|nr:hypothetical protein [Intrasporangiaceae bacterium]
MAPLHEANIIITDAGIDDEAAGILTAEVDEVIIVEVSDDKTAAYPRPG